MVKTGIFLALVIAIINTASGQDTTTIYLDSEWIKTSEKKAAYIEQRIKKRNDKFIIKQTSINNAPISICNYSSLKPKIEQGMALYFNEEGVIAIRGFYSNGFMSGTWYVMNNESDVLDTLKYSGIEDIFMGNESSASFPEVFSNPEVMPLFKNQEKSEEEFLKYIKTNLHYPIRAKMNKTEGKVIIEFIVGPDGKVYNPVIKNKADKDLAFEALRLIRDSPQWLSGKQGGKNVPVKLTIPIEFVLLN